MDAMDETNKSEVARIKQQIAIEYQAASRVFTDFNAAARHAYLTARQEKLGACLEELTQHMSPEDAMQTFIQAQVETTQKLACAETDGSSPGKLLADELNTHATDSYDETDGSSPGKLLADELNTHATDSYDETDGSSSGTTS